MLGHTFSIKRMQTHDGPGFRTTVFMKGCALRCAWCHNPESLSAGQEVWLDENKCIGCGLCYDHGGVRTTHDNWNGDIRVAESCPSKALELLRRTWTVEELVGEIERDAAFIEDGGVTFSGGEPAQQWRFVAEAMEACKARKLHTALDTCGAATSSAFEALLAHADLVLFDLKILDPDEHRKWTGQDNRQIMANLRQTAERVRNNESRLWIRTPLIPEATATVDNISDIGGYVRDELSDAVDRWELCSFNNLCVEKYRWMEMDWRFSESPLLDRSVAEELFGIAMESSGLENGRLFLKGRFQSVFGKLSI